MDNKCEYCWKQDRCTEEEKKAAADYPFPNQYWCFEAPDDDDAKFERLREERYGI